MSDSPGILLLVRHAESEGNVARELFEAANSETIDIDVRDADVALTWRGRHQASALGGWLAEVPAQERPSILWSSPYLRARETIDIAVRASGTGIDAAVRLDERLRDRELGILDRLTKLGVRQRFPSEADRRAFLGKLYYRPPGGESWADVALRLRSFVSDVRVELEEKVVLIVAHDAVILLLRYVLQGFDEATLLDIARRRSVGNASITRLVHQPAAREWMMDMDNEQRHLSEHGATPTAHEAEHDVDPR